MSRSKTSPIEQIIEQSREYVRTGTIDPDAWNFADPQFDNAFESALPTLMPLVADEYQNFLDDVYRTAALLEFDAPDHPLLAENLKHWNEDIDEIDPLEEHRILFLPIVGPVAKIAALVANAETRASLVSHFTSRGLVPEGTTLTVCPFALTPQSMVDVRPGQLHRFTSRVAAAYREAEGEPSALNEALVHLSTDFQSQSGERPSDDDPITMVGSRCLVLHRVRVGIFHHHPETIQKYGHDIEIDPILDPDETGYEVLDDAIRTLTEPHNLIARPPCGRLEAQTLMTSLHLRMAIDIDQIMQGQKNDPTPVQLHIYNDGDDIQIFAEFKDTSTGPITVSASLALADAERFFDEMDDLSDRISLYDHKTDFDKSIARLVKTRKMQ